MVRTEVRDRFAAVLTDEQERAVAAHDVSVALSAGAGCGKTHVLTERFLSHLAPGDASVDFRDLVAITFTERAAREMRDRIRRHCHGRLARAAEDEAAHWLARLREIDDARISTIHSFCAQLLRSHAVEARIDPQFTVLDQAQGETLLRGVVDEELRSRLAEHNETVIELASRFGLDGTRQRLLDLLRDRADIDFDHWSEVSPEDVVALWHEFQLEVTVPEALARLPASRGARRMRELLENHEPSHAGMQARRRVLLEGLQGMTNGMASESSLAELHGAARVQGGGGKSAWHSEQLYEDIKECLSGFRSEVDKLRKSLAPISEQALPSAAVGLELLRLGQGVAEAYERRKAEAAALDFDDLLIRARDLLCDPRHEALRKALGQDLGLLLVDEFQDTDRLQLELVSALCGDALLHGKLFIVGDYKQSIYRFRGADPAVFLETRETILPEGRLPLTMNFRSQPGVLDFVNALFCDAMGAAYEPLVAYREALSSVPCVELITLPTTEEARERVDQRRGREADLIARRILAMLDSSEPAVLGDDASDSDPAGPRPVRKKDIAILFRALSGVQFYEDALRRYDIDYYLVGGHAFYMQQEIYDLVNLLRCLVSHCDEVSLLGTLRSPMFSLTDESLYWLAQHAEGLAAGLFSGWRPNSIDSQQRQRVDFAADVLDELRRSKDRLSVAELIRHSIEMTGYDAVLLAEFLGERKLANLHKLIELARRFDSAGTLSLLDFITQLSEYVARQPKEALAATQHESADIVRLMTIHQAKGLEFPVVFVPEVEFTTNPGRSTARFDRGLGPLVRLPDDDADRALCGMDLHAQSESSQDEQELIRLLYVATTRAADHLVLSGVPPAGATPRSMWSRLLEERFDLELGRVRAQLPAAFAVPEIRIVDDELLASPQAGQKSVGTRLLRTLDKAERLASEQISSPPNSIELIAADLGARRHYSFSRLSGKLRQADGVAADATTQIDSEESDINPLALGTLVHEVLAEIPFGKSIDASRHVQRHAATTPGRISDELVATAIALVEGFLKTPRAAALAGAKQRHTELEFLLPWPPGSNQPGSKYLQGYIDCLYQDSTGAWHVLDYKTDQIDGLKVAEKAAAYEMQLLAYAVAVEQILGEAPATIVLHFLRNGAEHAFQLTEPNRARLVEMVDRAIQSVEADKSAVASN